MNILVTGANGFIAQNLISKLKNLQEDYKIYEYDLNTSSDLLEKYCRDCEFVYNLAGVNRPKDILEYKTGNLDFTRHLLKLLEENNNKCPLMHSSSVQAIMDNPYGKSKLESENLIFEFQKKHKNSVMIYRFTNLFGKWCKPNYNSVVATFCYNIARALPIQIHDSSTILNLQYIDDVIDELVYALNGHPTVGNDGFCHVKTSYQVTLGEIADALYTFKNSRVEKNIPKLEPDSFYKKLYSTYLSYLPPNQFSYPLQMNIDERGSFTELFKTPERGQVSINISKPGIVKGNHWHHTKVEKFIVVSGKGLIQLRNIHDDCIINYYVSGDTLEVIDIPCGYTHNIINIGENELVTVMWCNECFDPKNPDTYPLEVITHGEKNDE